MRNSIELFSPFGPCIGKVRLPLRILTELNQACDDLAVDEPTMASADFSNRLAGKVKYELSIPDELMNLHMGFWNTIVQEYITRVQEAGNMGIRWQQTDHCVLGFQEGWFVRSFAGDYNPTHVHPGATVSIAGYLKLPEWEDELEKELKANRYAGGILVEGKGPTAGRICFSHGSPTELMSNSSTLLPIIGEAFIFPSMLSHAVYPFESSGERRSFSLNFGRIELS